jgi:hypothetical protein
MSLQRDLHGDGTRTVNAEEAREETEGAHVVHESIRIAGGAEPTYSFERRHAPVDAHDTPGFSSRGEEGQ